MRSLLHIAVFLSCVAFIVPAVGPTSIAGETASVLTTPPPGGWPAKPPIGSRTVTLTSASHARAQYVLAVPPTYDASKEWPLWIVLHGGPNGGDPSAMVSFYRGGLLARGAIAVFPRSLDDVMLTWNYPAEGMYLLRIIEQVAKEYRIDPRRIYLAGHSMGGGGTWAMGAVLSDVWAGIGPMSGWYAATPRPNPEWLKGLPIWCIHGETDSAVPVQMSRMAQEAVTKVGHRVTVLNTAPTPESLEKLAPTDAVFRYMPGVGHDIFAPFATRGSTEIGAQVAWLSGRKRATPADLNAAAVRLTAWGKGFNWTPTGAILGSVDGKPVRLESEPKAAGGRAH